MLNKSQEKRKTSQTKLITESSVQLFKNNSEIKVKPRYSLSLPPETRDYKGDGKSIISKFHNYISGFISRQQTPQPPTEQPKSQFLAEEPEKTETLPPTRVISEALATKGTSENVDSDLLTDNLENVGKPPELSEFVLAERGTISDPVVLSSDETSAKSSSGSFGKSFGSTQFWRGKGFDFFFGQGSPNLDERIVFSH